MKPIYTFVLLLITQLVADAAGEATTNGRTNAPVATPSGAPTPAPLATPAGRPAAPPAPGAPAAPPAFPVQPAPAPRSPAAKAQATTNAAPTIGESQPVAAGMIRLENPNEVVGPFKFENMHLQQFLDVYAELVNRTILRASTSFPSTMMMTLDTRGKTLTKADAVTAFETVMAMNGIAVVPIGDKFVKVVLEGTAPQQGGEFYSGEAKDLPTAGRFVTQVVQLKYISTQDAAAAIQPFAKGLGGSIVPIQASQTLVIRDYSENIKRIMEILEKIDTVSELQIKPELIPIKYALATDIATVLGNLTASGAGVSVGSQSRGGLSRPGASYQPGSTQPGSTLPGQTQPNLGQTGLSSPATSGRSSFQNRLSSIVSRAAASGEFQILGETKIIADERTNSLLIFANSQDMLMIKDIIAQLDVVLAQVLIEAMIMEVSLDDSENYSVSFQQQPKKLGGGVRTAGGSTPNNNFLNPRSDEFTFSKRDTNQLTEKEIIGKAVADLIQPNQTVVVDAGTTVYHAARYLENKTLQIITNSLPVANHFAASQRVEVVLSGGVIYPRLGVLVGPLAVETFSKIHADVAIMSAGGITADGITNSHGLLIDIQRMMIQNSRKVIFCFDHTKLGRQSVSALCDLSCVDVIVTNDGAPSEVLDALRAKEVEIIIAPSAHA